MSASNLILSNLQNDIVRMQGFKSGGTNTLDTGWEPIRQAFPFQAFPIGCMHEFLPDHSSTLAPAIGFISALLTTLVAGNKTCVWISASRTLFPPALKNFGLTPHQFIFIDTSKEKEIPWALDEALKCSAVAAVVGEVRELDFNTSRRFQLAAEKSGCTGFMLRTDPRRISTTACVSRWKVTSLPSEPIEDLPGIGAPAWKIELQRVRNGKTGTWHMQWRDSRLTSLPLHSNTEATVEYPPLTLQRKVG